MSRLVAVILATLLVAGGGRTQNADVRSAAEADLIRGWSESGALGQPLAHAVMAAEGPVRPVDLRTFDARVEALFTDLDQRVRDRDDYVRKLRAIWRHLEDEVFRQYRPDAHLSDLFEDGTYSSVSGTLLLLLAAERYGVPVLLYETPVHFFLAVESGPRSILMDVTDLRRGFNFDDPRRVSEHLARVGLISAAEVALGAEAVYTQVIREATPVSSVRLVAHTYLIQVAPALEEGRLDEAFTMAERAWMFAEGDEAYGLTHALLLGQVGTVYGYDGRRFAPYLLRAIELRTGDDSFVDQVLPLLLTAPRQLAAERDFESAELILDRARTALPLSSDEVAQLNYVAAVVAHDRAVSLLNRGDLEAAQEAAAQARTLAPGEVRIEETYVMTTCRLGLWHAERGEVEQALTEVTALLIHADEYPVVRDTYARVAMFALQHPDEQVRLHRDNPDEALRLLLQAHEVAPEATFLREAIGWAYHEMAMAKVRDKDYVTARTYVDAALQYAPNSSFLQEDYDLIDQFERNEW